MLNIDILSERATALLEKLIATPSLSRQEDQTASILFEYLQSNGLNPQREGNNVWCRDWRSDNLPVILLDAHHDTVKPVSSWKRDPFKPQWEGDRLYGLGSNDDGASLVTMLETFIWLSSLEDRPYNLVFSASAEEEVSGKNGLKMILPQIGRIDLAIVGEPTGMQMAVAEKGLLVLDCSVRGKTGHAARNEGVNSIYLTMEDIDWFRTYRFPKMTELLGPVKMTVTMVQAGYQHNVVPDLCSYVVDVRPNECYSNLEILDEIKSHLKYTEVSPRSTDLCSSCIALDHPFVKKGLRMGLKYYGSPTCSDQVRIPYTSIKIGPGDSSRSHTADEYILRSEIGDAIRIYAGLLEDFTLQPCRSSH